MQMMEAVATKIPHIAKLMLTCFISNQRAIHFYEKLGYSKDEFSPAPKLLRSGIKIEPDYVILSKAVVALTE
jgi:N-alpha-acetyltransferase 40